MSEHWVECRRIGGYGSSVKSDVSRRGTAGARWTNSRLACRASVTEICIPVTRTSFTRVGVASLANESRTTHPSVYGDVLFAASGETIEEIGKSAVNLINDDAYCRRGHHPVSPEYRSPSEVHGICNRLDRQRTRKHEWVEASLSFTCIPISSSVWSCRCHLSASKLVIVRFLEATPTGASDATSGPRRS